MLRGMFLVAVLVLAAGPSVAQEQPFGIGLTAGTLGVGPEISYRFDDKLVLRANATLIDTHLFEVDAKSDDIDFDTSVKRRHSGGAMLDYYPTGNGFRLSVGIRVTGERAWLEATPTSDVTIGLRTVTPAQVGKLRARYRVRDWAPAVMVGYVTDLAPQLALGFEAGAIFQGAPKIRRLRSIGGTLSDDPAFAADLEAERMTIENDIDDYRFHPVVQLSLGYRF